MKQLFKMVIPLIGRAGVVTYFFLGILSGLSGFFFVNFVTRLIAAIDKGSYTSIDRSYILTFCTIILFFVWCKRSLALYSIYVTQRISWQLRKDIVALALNADYQQFSKRKEQIQSGLFADVSALTSASMSVIDFFTAIIMTFACLFYLASLSGVLFLLTIFIAILGITVYSITTKINVKRFEKTRDLENRFYDSINSIINGFKDIYMEPQKGRYIYKNQIIPIALKAYEYTTTALSGFVNSQMVGQILFYILISAVLLVFSVILKIKTGDLIGFVFTLIFLLGSIETVMALLPALLRAGVAAKRLKLLREDLESQNFKNPIVSDYTLRDNFRNLEVRDLEFYFAGEDREFKMGPVSLTINQGEIIFIFGSNGSGKTTLINTLLGVYRQTSGEIYVNQKLIDNTTFFDYKAMFSVVFSDFYLFKEIMTDAPIDKTKIDFYLNLFEIDQVVTLKGNLISTVNLSTGQKKRLALVIALMEKKPILVIDEWAADQDPYFRRKFYNEILGILKNEGMTIIAITHDDHYYRAADRLFKMNEGRLYQETIQKDKIGLLQ